MGNENIPGGNEPEYPREIYEPVLAPSIDLDAYLKQELTISYFDTDGDHEMQACYGDIKLTIDALMDYTQMLGTVCEQWKLAGFHRASYEYHADRLRKFAVKLQAAIGYDYAATLEKCRKKQKRKPRYDDIGEDGITLAAKHRKAPAQEDSGDRGPSDDSPSEAYPLSEEEEAFPPAGDIPSPEETDFKVTIEKLEGGPHTEKNELRTVLEGHLDTLKRNLAVVSWKSSRQSIISLLKNYSAISAPLPLPM